MVTCLIVAACASSPSFHPLSATHQPSPSPGLPVDARVVNTVDVSLPAVAHASSALPGVDQRDVFFVDSRTGFLASGGEEAATNQGGIYTAMSGGIQRTSDGGTTWQTAWTAPGADISTVVFASRSLGFAAGMSFSTSQGTTDNGQPLLLRTTDGGATWTALSPRLPSDVDAWRAIRLVAGGGVILAVIDPNQWGGGPYRAAMLRSADGGHNWSEVVLPGGVPSGGVAFASSGSLYATGELTNSQLSQMSQLWRSYDAGKTWSPVAGTRVPFNLYALSFADSVHGYAAGGNLAKFEMRPSRGLLATSDGGRTWSLRYQSPDADISNPITRLRFLDANHGWAAIGGCSMGQNGPCGGRVLLTADGGRSWRQTNHDAVEISAVSATEAWTIGARGPNGGFVWHSTDAGASWAPVVRPGVLGITSLAGSHGWLVAATPAGSWQSSDDGTSWSAFNPPMLAPGQQWNGATVVAQPPGLLIVNDGSAVRISHDGGVTVTGVTLPGQDPTTSPQIYVAFSDSTTGFAIVGGQMCTKPPGYTGNGSPPPVAVPSGSTTLAISRDGGTTWSALDSFDLQPLAVSAADQLWAISGSTLCARPRPAVMISRDQGKRWTTQGMPQACFAIGVAAPGTIWLGCLDSWLVTQDGAMTWTRYHFAQGPPWFLVTGPSEMWAYGPAGALWHTSDGGHSWNAMTLPF